MTLTAVRVIFHKISAIDDIGIADLVLGRFRMLDSDIPISPLAQMLWKTSPSAVKVICDTTFD